MSHHNRLQKNQETVIGKNMFKVSIKNIRAIYETIQSHDKSTETKALTSL